MGKFEATNIIIWVTPLYLHSRLYEIKNFIGMQVLLLAS